MQLGGAAEAESAQPTARAATQVTQATMLGHVQSAALQQAVAPEVLSAMPRASEGDIEALGRAVERAERTYTRPGVAYIAGDDDDLDGWIAQALGLMGLPQDLAPGVKKIVMHESGGDPDAINNYDSNAAAGNPSEGLMQVIPVVFEACVLPELADEPITDPVANITAGVRAMIANHGIETVMQGGRRSSSGNYMGYGGAKVPGDGLSDDAVEYLQQLQSS